jgi:hypothetical protein
MEKGFADKEILNAIVTELPITPELQEFLVRHGVEFVSDLYHIDAPRFHEASIAEGMDEELEKLQRALEQHGIFVELTSEFSKNEFEPNLTVLPPHRMNESDVRKMVRGMIEEALESEKRTRYAVVIDGYIYAHTDEEAREIAKSLPSKFEKFVGEFERPEVKRLVKRPFASGYDYDDIALSENMYDDYEKSDFGGKKTDIISISRYIDKLEPGEFDLFDDDKIVYVYTKPTSWNVKYNNGVASAYRINLLDREIEPYHLSSLGSFSKFVGKRGRTFSKTLGSKIHVTPEDNERFKKTVMSLLKKSI